MKPIKTRRESTPWPGSGLKFIALLFALTVCGPLAAQGGCDCSCEAYQETRKALERYSEAANSGEGASLSPEVVQMMQCSAVCTTQWRSCGEDASRTDTPSGLSKDQLNPAYLQGIWCSVYGGQETTEWLFHEDGSYQIGVPAGGGYALQPDVRTLQQFHDRFEQLTELEPDTFTTLHKHGRKNVFKRGSCG